MNITQIKSPNFSFREGNKPLKCQYCNDKDIIKKSKETWVAFNKRQYCSHACYHLASRGMRKNVQPNSLKNLIHGFIKGMIPWNKGRIGEYKLWPNGRKFTLEHIAKIKEGVKGKSVRYWLGKKRPEISGKNNYRWKGGITPLYWRIRNSFEYKNWREAVFKRDNFTCVLCKARCGKGHPAYIEADHIVSFSSILHNNKIDTFDKALNCKLLWDTNNGRTLCHNCHLQTANYGHHIGEQKLIHFFKNNYSYK